MAGPASRPTGGHQRRVAIVLRHEPLAPLNRQRLTGVKRYIQEHHHQWRVTLVQPTASSAEVAAWRPDGLITGVERAEWAGLGLPTVSTGDEKPLPDLPGNAAAVRVDQAHIGGLAAGHLLDRRFARFACVGLRGLAYAEQRRDAFVAELARAGHACQTFAVGPWNSPAGPERPPIDELARWVAGLVPPVAVFAANDPLALAVMRACREAGRDVPRDVAVLGVDDVDLDCEIADPPLSSVVNPVQAVGHKAAELLDRLFAGDAGVPRLTLVRSPGVHVRQSTDMTAVDDEVVAEAIAFVRQRLHGVVGVGEVAEALCVSRGTLHRRFMDALGHGPLREIHRLRVQRAEELLALTDLPMPAVAARCGFAHAAHMTRIFRSVLGTTPSHCRRRSKQEQSTVASPRDDRPR